MHMLRLLLLLILTASVNIAGCKPKESKPTVIPPPGGQAADMKDQNEAKPATPADVKPAPATAEPKSSQAKPVVAEPMQLAKAETSKPADDLTPPAAGPSEVKVGTTLSPKQKSAAAKFDPKGPVAPTGHRKVKLGSPELTAGIPGQGDVTLEELKAWLANPKNHEILEVELPLGLSAGKNEIKGLDENPLTMAKIELGRQLFFDKRLSAESTVACATCHDPAQGFTAHTQFGVGIRNQMGGRNSPVAFNRILSGAQFWDGRAGSLEEQALGPIQNPIEMGNTHKACVECLQAIEGYRVQFEKIFGQFSIDNVGRAIASFERTLVTGPSPYDYYDQFHPLEKLDADDLAEDPKLKAKYDTFKALTIAHPMSASAKRGRELFFGKANCTACHVGANFSDEKYHNLGVGMNAPIPDEGRKKISRIEQDMGAYKTPTVRNITQTGPYMHDGSQKTLEEVVEWYDKGGHPNPHLSEKVKKLNLTAEQKKDLVEFMKALTGSFPVVQTGRLPKS